MSLQACDFVPRRTSFDVALLAQSEARSVSFDIALLAQSKPEA